MIPLYIGYFTIGTPYQMEAVECMKTLDAFGLEHEFVGVPNSRSWVRNCARKPEVIRKLHLKHDGRPLVYIDADARVRRKPIAFELIAPDVDIACHYRNGGELLSGTVYMGATADARRLLDLWCDGCKKQPDDWDQITLQNILREQAFNVYRLPAPYCSVFDDPTMGPPVIEHLQASRRLANLV